MKKIFILLSVAGLLYACKSTNKVANNQIATYKPEYHYTPEKNWVNDPNGLIYLDGEYHIFHQYNPLGDKWGHMSWGHAVSKDLKTWNELPMAIPEIINADGSATMVFSGATVVDSFNTSGFFEKGFTKGMVAIYTSHIEKNGAGAAQHQSLGYSADRGRTWKFYDKNPVLDIGLKDFRDPNVFWYEGKWKMIVSKPLEYTVQIYESANLKEWILLSEFGKLGDTAKIWECPSLFKVPVENTDISKWVMLISSAAEDTKYTGMQYFVGDFDGKKFTSDTQVGVLRLDYGKDFYAAIPFNNLPVADKGPVIIGWASNWAYAQEIPAEGSRGLFSMPRRLSLVNKNGKFQLIQKPIYSDKINTLTLSLKADGLSESKIIDMPNNSYRLNLTVDLGKAKGFTIDLLKNNEIKSILNYDVATQNLSFDRTRSGKVDFDASFPSIETMRVYPENGQIKLDIFVDNSLVEIFANEGKKVLSDLVFPHTKGGKVRISAVK